MAGRLHTPRWPNRAIKPPYGAVEIDWAHPLTRGLGGYWLFNEAGGLRANDLCGKTPLTLTTPGWDSRKYGTALTGSPKAVNAAPLGVVGGFPTSLLIRFYVTNAATTQYLIHANSYAASGQALAIAVNGGMLYYYQGGVRYSATVTSNTWTTAVFAFASATSVAAYVNGVPVSIDQPLGAFTPGSAKVYIGALDGTSYSMTGAVSEAAIYNRAINADEALRLYADPYCFLRPVIRRSYGFVGAAGGTAYEGTVALAVTAAAGPAGQEALLAQAVLQAWQALAGQSTHGARAAATLAAVAALGRSGRQGALGGSALGVHAALAGSSLQAAQASAALAALANLQGASQWTSTAQGTLSVSAALAASRAAVTHYLATASLEAALALGATGPLSLRAEALLTLLAALAPASAQAGARTAALGATAALTPAATLALDVAATLAAVGGLTAAARLDLAVTAALDILASVAASRGASTDYLASTSLDAAAALAATTTLAAHVQAALAILGQLQPASQTSAAVTALLAATIALQTSRRPDLTTALIWVLAEAILAGAVTPEALTHGTLTDGTLMAGGITDDDLQ